MRSLKKGLTLLFLTYILCGCIKTIQVTPTTITGAELISVELGKTYTVKNNSELILSSNGNYIALIKSKINYQPEVDSIFKSQFPRIVQNNRFQIVGMTDD